MRFFLNDLAMSTKKKKMTGYEIKVAGGISMIYQLFKEGEVDTAINDGVLADMRGEPRFYTVPPATGS